MSTTTQSNAGQSGAMIVSAMDEVAAETAIFELAQRKAKIYSESSLVPKEYYKNIGNVLIAQNMARRMGADALMVMQNLYIVHNRPGWSAQFLIACFNSCGRFSAIKYTFDGQKGTDEWGCTAHATEMATGELIEGTKITIAMAKKEGWHEKNGSKWKTMPEQMMRYRAATFLIRTTAPEIGMGLMTKEEIDDSMTIDEQPRRPKIPAKSLDDLTERLEGRGKGLPEDATNGTAAVNGSGNGNGHTEANGTSETAQDQATDSSDSEETEHPEPAPEEDATLPDGCLETLTACDKIQAVSELCDKVIDAYGLVGAKQSAWMFACDKQKELIRAKNAKGKEKPAEQKTLA